MHLPRPKLFRKRQARPDKPIRNFFRRFFCVFALCMTAPQPVTISQDEQIRQSGSNGRCRRQRTPKYEQKISSGSSNTDSLFTTSEISVGLPVVPKISHDTNTQNAEHLFASICDPIPLDDVSATISTTLEISDMSSITSDGISECNDAKIKRKEVFSIPKANSCTNLSESSTCSTKDISQLFNNNDRTGKDNYNDVTRGPYPSSPMPYEYFNAEEFSKERFIIVQKHSSGKVSKSNSIDSFHDIFGIFNGSFGEYVHKNTKSKLNDTVKGNDDKVNGNDDNVKYTNEKTDLNGDTIATSLINDVIENLFESKVNQNKCEPEIPNDGTKMITKIVGNGIYNTNENDHEIPVTQPATPINENNSVKVDHRALDNNEDDSKFAGKVNSDGNPTEDECGYISDFLNNIIKNVCNKPSNKVASLNDVDAEIERLLEDNEIVSHGKNKVFDNDAEIERLLEDYEIISHSKKEVFEQNKKNKFQNLHLKPFIGSTSEKRKICSTSNGIMSKSPLLARPTTTNNPTRQNYIYLNETYESTNLSGERLSSSKKFQNNNNSFKKNNTINKYVDETHPANERYKKTSQPQELDNILLRRANKTNIKPTLGRVSEDIRPVVGRQETTQPKLKPLKQISGTFNSSLECVTKPTGRVVEVIKPTLGRVIEEKIPNVGQASEHKFGKVSKTANVLQRICESTGSSFKPSNDTNKLKLKQNRETTNTTIRQNNDTKQLELEQNCETTNPSIIPVIETRKLKIKQLCVPTTSTFVPVIETCKLELDQICVTTTPTFIPSDTRKEIICETTNPTFRIPFIETRIMKLEDVCVKGTTTLIPVISTRKFKLEEITDACDTKLKQLTEVKTLIEQPENIPDTISAKLSPVVSHSSQSKLEEFGKRSSYALGQTDNKESGYASSKNIHERSLKTIHQVILEEEEEEEEYAESTIINAESSVINADDDHMTDRSHL